MDNISESSAVMPFQQTATINSPASPKKTSPPLASKKVQDLSAGSNLAQKSLTIEPTITSNAMPAVATTPPLSSSKAG